MRAFCPLRHVTLCVCVCVAVRRFRPLVMWRKKETMATKLTRRRANQRRKKQLNPTIDSFSNEAAVREYCYTERLNARVEEAMVHAVMKQQPVPADERDLRHVERDGPGYRAAWKTMTPRRHATGTWAL